MRSMPWGETLSTNDAISEKRFHFGLLTALFRDAAFDDSFAECVPLPIPFLMTESVVYPSTRSNREGSFINWIVTFFLLAVVASFFGFGGLTGTFAAGAKILAVIFLIVFLTLFVVALFYNILVARRPTHLHFRDQLSGNSRVRTAPPSG